MLGGASVVALWPRTPAPDPTNFAWSFLFFLLFFSFLLPPPFSFPCAGVTLGGEGACGLGTLYSKPVVVAVVAVSPPEHV